MLSVDEFAWKGNGRSLFITGLDGFAAAHLSSLARNCGFNVCGISRRRHCPGEGIFQCDITNSSCLKTVLTECQPDFVAHLSGVSAFLNNSFETVYQTNLVGSRNLLEALSELNTPPSRVLLVSSGNVCDPSLSERLGENAPYAPITDYSVSKIAMELLAPWWSQHFPIVVARPFNHIGRGQLSSFLVPRLITGFRRRSPLIEVGNLNAVRDFSDVRDTVKSYLSLLLIPNVPAHPINVCTGIGHSVRALIGLLEKITSHSPKLHVSPDYTRTSEIPKLVGNPLNLIKSGAHVPKIALRDCLEWILSE
jgi:nucleoside-diphosphate-sugar epimerase